MLFGHGSVFRDFNFVMDERAATKVLAMHLPLVLVPYDAARDVEITAADLDRLLELGGAAPWVAERARAWLDYWRDDIGRHGFYPFDLLAADYLIDARGFRCAPVHAWVGKDKTLFVPFWNPTALLVGPDPAPAAGALVDGAAYYCPELTPSVARQWLHRLADNRWRRAVHPNLGSRQPRRVSAVFSSQRSRRTCSEVS